MFYVLDTVLNALLEPPHIILTKVLLFLRILQIRKPRIRDVDSFPDGHRANTSKHFLEHRVILLKREVKSYHSSPQNSTGNFHFPHSKIQGPYHSQENPIQPLLQSTYPYLTYLLILSPHFLGNSALVVHSPNGPNKFLSQDFAYVIPSVCRVYYFL